MPTTRRILAPLALILANAAPCQDTARFVPASPWFVVTGDGPAALERQFDGTNLGDLLASDELAALADALAADYEPGEHDEELDQLGELFTEYGGRWTLAVTRVGESGFAVLAELGTDQEADFAAMAELVEGIAEAEADELSDVDIGEHTFRGVDGPDGMTLLLPTVVDGRLIAILAQADPEALEAALDLDVDDRFRTPEAFARAGLAMRADIGALLEFAFEQAPPDGPFEPEELLTALGIDTMRRMDATIRPADERVRLDMKLAVESGEPSLLDVMRPRSRGAHSLLSLVPRSHSDWSVFNVRVDEIYDLIMAMAELAGQPGEFLEDMFEENFKVRLKADLIDHLGDEIVALASPSAATFDESAEAAGMAFAMKMADAESFERAFDTALRSRGLHAARKTRDYRGIKVRSLNLLGMFDLHYSFVDGLGVLGFGSDGAELMQLLLDGVAMQRAGEEPGAFEGEVQARLEALPDGWQGVSSSDVTGTLKSMTEAASTAAALDGEAPAGIMQLLVMLDDFADLLKKFELDRVVTTTTFDDDGVVVRAIW